MCIHFYITEAISRKKFETSEEWLRNNNKCSDYNGSLESGEIEAFRSSQSLESSKRVRQDNRKRATAKKVMMLVSKKQ